jgi:hypothetical protein
MVALEMHAGERGWGETQVFADLFSALGGWTLGFPFDSRGKSFPQEMLDASPFRGGVRIAPRPMRVLGLHAPPRAEAPDLVVPGLRLSQRPEEVAALLGGLLERVDRARLAPFFTAEDFAAAKTEVESGRADLSHGLRRATHAVTADLVAGIAEARGPS